MNVILIRTRKLNSRMVERFFQPSGWIWSILLFFGCGVRQPVMEPQSSRHGEHTGANAKDVESVTEPHPNRLIHQTNQRPTFFDGLFDSISQEWFSEILIAAHENRIHAEPEAESFRFIWARSSDPPWVFRLERNQNGKHTITTKSLNVVGSEFEYAVSYTLGTVTTVNVAEEDVQELRDLINRAGFWKMPTNGALGGMDGSAWVIEGLVGTKYHVVHRQSPIGDFENVGRWFMHAGGLEIPTDPDEYY